MEIWQGSIKGRSSSNMVGSAQTFGQKKYVQGILQSGMEIQKPTGKIIGQDILKQRKLHGSLGNGIKKVETLPNVWIWQVKFTKKVKGIMQSGRKICEDDGKVSGHTIYIYKYIWQGAGKFGKWH